MTVLRLMHFLKNSGRLSSRSPEILAFSGHYSANFQLILDCFVPNVNLKFEDWENIETDCVNTVFLDHIKSNRETYQDH